MKNKTSTAKILTESAIMIALATVLSMLKLADLPYGGSVTVASMLPIAIIAYRHGTGWGLLSGLVHGVIQQLLGIHFLNGMSWQGVIAIILLDYIVAFLVIGFAGIFKKAIKNQALSLATGCLFICILRYICHVISGATVWAGISIPTASALTYSLIYNATFMVPETIVLVIAALYIGGAIDFRTEMPTRMIKKDIPANISWISPVAGLLASLAVIFDIAKIFEKLQDGKTGEFTITAISEVDWISIIIMTAVVAATVIALLMIRRSVLNKNKEAK